MSARNPTEQVAVDIAASEFTAGGTKEVGAMVPANNGRLSGFGIEYTAGSATEMTLTFRIALQDGTALDVVDNSKAAVSVTLGGSNRSEYFPAGTLGGSSIDFAGAHKIAVDATPAGADVSTTALKVTAVFDPIA